MNNHNKEIFDSLRAHPGFQSAIKTLRPAQRRVIDEFILLPNGPLSRTSQTEIATKLHVNVRTVYVSSDQGLAWIIGVCERYQVK